MLPFETTQYNRAFHESDIVLSTVVFYCMWFIVFVSGVLGRVGVCWGRPHYLIGCLETLAHGATRAEVRLGEENKLVGELHEPSMDAAMVVRNVVTCEQDCQAHNC